MEESTPTDAAVTDPVAVTSSAMRDHDAAASAYRAAVDAAAADATADYAAAAAALAGVTDTATGEAANALDRIDGAVVKHLARIVDAAATDHASAINRLFGAGAAPLYVTEEMLADMERGDPVASALEQLLGPILAGAASRPVTRTDGDVTPITDMDGVEYTSPPTAPPATGGGGYTPPPAPVSPPVGDYGAGACPAPNIIIPPCPAPTVIVLPPPAGGPPIPPTPVVTPPPAEPPPPWPEPTEPPPPAEPPPVVGPPVLVGPPAPAPVRPPPVLPPTTVIVPETAGVPPPTRPAPWWDSAARCGVLGARGQRGEQELIDAIVLRYRDRYIAATAEDERVYAINEEQWRKRGVDLPKMRRIGRDAILAEMRQYADSVAGWSMGSDGADLVAAAAIGAANALDRWAGGPATYLVQGYQYDLQYSSPQYLPSQEQVDHMYLSRAIDDDLWTCLTKANGNHPWAYQLLRDAKRSRASTRDAVNLWRQGRINYAEMYRIAQTNGVLSEADLNVIIDGMDFIPPYTDLTRFMVRDSADEGVVLRYGYDDGFEDKYKGPIKRWAQAQGIDDTTMRYIWRAHWQIPSPTQLYEMLHRLRPGRVAPGVEVTRDDVSDALKVNDMSPGFVDRLIETSYSVMTRTDILAFFTNGSMDYDEVVERLMDTGYNRADATRVADAWRLEVANRRANKSRVWSRTNIVRMYRDGAIDRASAAKLLRRTIATDVEVGEILDDVDMMRAATTKSKCIKAVRKRRIMGELSEVESRIELGRLNVDLAVASTMAEGWTCEIASMAREPSVKMLTDWFLHGIIDVTELDKRLRNLRFAPKDAERIIRDIVADWNERMERQAAAAARRAAAEEVRRRKEAERLAEKRKKRLACLRKGTPPDEC